MLASDGFALNCAGLRYASVPPSNEFPAMASVMPLPEPPPAGARVIFGYAVVSGATSSCRNGSSSDDPLSLNVTAVVGLPVAAGFGVPVLVAVPPQATTASVPRSAMPPIKPVRMYFLSYVSPEFVAGDNRRNNSYPIRPLTYSRLRSSSAA
jgi:hypothetical protein